jgi:hypothetical protein
MKSERRPTLFLTELTFDLLIFALCAAVCAALLVKARGMSRDSRELTDAVALAQTAAETLRGQAPADGALESGALRAEYACTRADALIEAEIRVYADARLVYTLKAAWPEAQP